MVEKIKENLELQINFLLNTPNLALKIFEDEPDPLSQDSKFIDGGINLYLKTVHNKCFNDDMQNLINSIRANEEKIEDDIDDENKQIKSIEHELNWITQEKIAAFNEKEEIDEKIELVEVNNSNLFGSCLTQNARTNEQNNNTTTIDNNINNTMNDINDNDNAVKANRSNENYPKRLKEVKKKYETLINSLATKKKDFNKKQKQNQKYISDNNLLREKIKQKRMILEQLNKNNSSKQNSQTNIKVLKTEAEEEFESEIAKKNDSCETREANKSSRLPEPKRGRFSRFFMGILGK